MIDGVGRWRELERVVRERDLDWGLNYAPPDLRYARSVEHAYGGRFEHLLPADYRAFVGEVGYPVVGFSYYDRLGISFLPPEAIAYVSVDLPDQDDAWPVAGDGEPTLCRHAFFAGSDLSEIDGYSFGPAQDGGELVVWQVERGLPREERGTFTEWLDSEISRLIRHTNSWVPEEDEEVEDDPHRLIDYSLAGHYGQPPFTPADLDLFWVVDNGSRPYTHGLVDGAGAWRIPLGPRFLDVRPFRDGVAEVVLEAADASWQGPWVRIHPDGSTVTT